MIRKITMWTVAALLVVALAAPAAFAASAAARACEADPNSDFVQTGPGQWECVTTTTEVGPTPGTGNDPQTTEDETAEPQQGQGLGGGAKDEPVTLHCEYSQSGKLFANKSDEGCPDPQPTS